MREMLQKHNAEVLADIVAHPELTYAQIADRHGCSQATVQRVAQRNNICRPVGPRPQETKEEFND